MIAVAELPPGAGAGSIPALQLRLFVAGTGPNSVQALANLRSLLGRIGLAESSIEVVDCLEQPLRALDEGVVVSPTLVKHAPEPRAVIVGTLADHAQVLHALGVAGTLAADGTE